LEITSLTAHEILNLLRSRQISPKEVVTALSQRLEKVDPLVHAYLSHDLERALADADSADVSLPLGGLPISIKDVISVKGHPCGCASKILEGYIAPYDATVVSRLRAAGAIPFGRLNMDEFAMGSSTENSAFGPSKNPWDTTCTPGGSSGGSAAAVAADEAFAALGSDTGGSIRQPAALCGCVGLKPTYGRVSRYGLVAFASSLDQIGPLTKDVEDAALLMDCIAGLDKNDSTSLPEPVPNFSANLRKGVKGFKIGLPKEYFIEGLDPGVEKAVRTAVEHLQALGAELFEISLPHTEHALSAYYIIAPAEASANLARFDGVRYGFRASETKGLIDHYGRTREEGFGAEVKRRVILGTYVLSSGYYDAYYLRAQKVRTLIRRDFAEAFKKVDVIACPTSPTPAFRLGERTNDPLSMYLADIFTLAANMAGICGISIPCGFADQGGKQLPVGLQILGKGLDESTVLQTSYAYEQSTDWHKAKPMIGDGVSLARKNHAL
jgi:aspartyl-tRNA(Asn)/glutamyl-tRNA(Gln) amidotransferase subunit A